MMRYEKCLQLVCAVCRPTLQGTRITQGSALLGDAAVMYSTSSKPRIMMYLSCISCWQSPTCFCRTFLLAYAQCGGIHGSEHKCAYRRTMFPFMHLVFDECFVQDPAWHNPHCYRLLWLWTLSDSALFHDILSSRMLVQMIAPNNVALHPLSLCLLFCATFHM
jgi:hypothetical protein